MGELSLPAPEVEVATTCSRQACGGQLQLITSRLDKLRSRQRYNEVELTSLRCPKCDYKTTCSQQINLALDHGFQRLEGRHRLTTEEVKSLIYYGLPKRPDSGNEYEEHQWMLRLASIQNFVNVHDWKHRNSCFKSTRSTCRYNMPSRVVPETKATLVATDRSDNFSVEHSQKLELHVQKRPPFIFSVNSNNSITSVFNCNNFVSPVADQKLSLYCGAYATKYDNASETVATTILNNFIRYQSKNKEHKSDFSSGIGLLISSARASTSNVTVGAPMAAYLARGNKLFAMSHQTEPLPLAQAIHFLHRKPIYASIYANGTVSASIHNYVYRDHAREIENLNYWDFLATQELYRDKSHMEIEDRNSSSADESPQSTTTSVYRFTKEHPSHKTHGHKRRTRKVWPKVLGPRLPDLAAIDGTIEDSTSPGALHDKRESYAQGPLVMFVPFRKLTDLLNDHESWWDAYNRQKNLLLNDVRVRNILRNIQNYYETFCRINPHLAESEFGNISPDDNDEDVIDDIDLDASPFDQLDEQLINYTAYLDACEPNANSPVFEPFTDEFVVGLQSLPTAPIRLSQQKTSVTIKTDSARAACNKLPSSKDRQPFSLPGRERTDQLYQTSLPTTEPPSGSKDADTIHTTRIDILEKIDTALNPPQYNDISSPLTNSLTNSSFSSISTMCREWNLNDKQRVAFSLCAAAVLEKLYLHTNSTAHVTQPERNKRIAERLHSFLPANKQLILHLGGSGGTGKSRVIQAIVNFCDRWSATANLVVCAYCGLAATLIGGCTLHKALGIPVNSTPSTPSPTMIRAWAKIALLIVDECSLLSPSLIYLLDRRLRLLKDRKDDLFGGIHIVLSGDFFQLPPIGASLLNPLTTSPNMPRTAKETLWGQQLWSTCLTDVIILTTIVRQTNPTWTATLERFRINCPTLQDIATINDRLITPTTTTLLPPAGTITAVSANKTRHEAIQYIEQLFLSQLPIIDATDELNWRQRETLLIKANVTDPRYNTPVDPRHADYVRKLPEKRLTYVGNLFCIIGAKYMITANIDVANGIANGTIAILRNIILKDGVDVSVTNLGQGQAAHSVLRQTSSVSSSSTPSHNATPHRRTQPYHQVIFH